MTIDAAIADVAPSPGASPGLQAAWTDAADGRSEAAEPASVRSGLRALSIPIALSLAVLVTAAFAVAPLRDAVASHDVAGVHLARPEAYVALAPLSDVLDTLTLLSERQHVALVMGLVVLWAAWRFAPPSRRLQRRGAHARSFAVLIGAVVATSAAAAFLPRPMAYLASSNPDVVRIDFHSHTRSSKDAHRDFTVARSREWHRAGGYDVAYVTDHDTFTAAEEGLAEDPRTGRDGIVMLSGVEATWNGEHVGVVGDEQASRGDLSANLHDFHPRRASPAGPLGEREAVRAREPIVIWNHPRDPRLADVPLTRGVLAADVRAIEVSNGALHGMDLVRSKRSRIVALAREHDLAPVSGSDTHGWGHAAPNWTLMRIPGWRSLDRDALGARIAQEIRGRGFESTHVVERTTADPGASAVALALTVVAVPWRMLTTLSPAERAAWLFWTWTLAAFALAARRRGLAQRAAAPEPAA